MREYLYYMQKEALVNEVLEKIAHQWRQPLSQINSNVSVIDNILYENGIQNERVEEKLQEIERLTKYMSQTIDDFKSQISENISPVSVKLKDIIDDAIEVVSGSFQDHSITLAKDIDATLLCHKHQDSLKQIIVVLLNNAKDAIIERNIFNARVEISLKSVDGENVIAVSDNAGGITKSVMDKMFEPYYTTKHDSEGTGIGLEMAREMMQEKFSGTLNVKNQGEGSCFTLSFKEGK